MKKIRHFLTFLLIPVVGCPLLTVAQESPSVSVKPVEKESQPVKDAVKKVKSSLFATDREGVDLPALPALPNVVDPVRGPIPAGGGDNEPLLGDTQAVEMIETAPAPDGEPDGNGPVAAEVKNGGKWPKGTQFKSARLPDESVQGATGTYQKETRLTSKVEDHTAIDDLEVTSDPLNRFPFCPLPLVKKSVSEQNVEWLISEVAKEYSKNLADINDDSSLRRLPGVPGNMSANWSSRMYQRVWREHGAIRRTIRDTYGEALRYSHQIKSFSEIPVIRQTGIQEAYGQFDMIAFIDGRYTHTNEPTSSTLTTGQIQGRFDQQLKEGDFGVRKKLQTGTELSLTNSLSTLNNNSNFLQPNPQSGSEVVLSISHPLLKGGGYHYNTAGIKIAMLDSKMGVTEYVRQLEQYLLEISRTYWGVYLARANFVQKKLAVAQTARIVEQLEERAEVDPEANASELLRARSSVAQRNAALVRAEMSIRLAEDRLRTLVSGPDFALGKSTEIIPCSRPILAAPQEDVREVARAAISNRPELLEAFYQTQAAGIRRDLAKNELLPTLNLIIETSQTGLGGRRDLSSAIDDQWDNQNGHLFGFSFEKPLGNNFAKARHERRRHELRQQLSNVKTTIDNIALEAIVAYRELQTAYRDMQGKYQTALATREEVRELENRLNVDANGNSVGYQLQLILDALDRNLASEEAFLVSVVTYNVAFTSLDKARGSLLKRHDVGVFRTMEDGLNTIHAGFPQN
ncbi:MAG: TolC family protein [Verrucomicrobiales bacterium]|nr:TolC family protein [Verrucomicrobiales bacterium]